MCLARWQVRDTAHQASLLACRMTIGKPGEELGHTRAVHCRVLCSVHWPLLILNTLQDRALDGASDHQAPEVYHAIQQCNIQLLLVSDSGAWPGTGVRCVSHGAGLGKLQPHATCLLCRARPCCASPNFLSLGSHASLVSPRRKF